MYILVYCFNIWNFLDILQDNKIKGNHLYVIWSIYNDKLVYKQYQNMTNDFYFIFILGRK